MKPLQRVLYVEDEPFIQALPKVALEDVGAFEVCMCTSGRSAIALVESFAPDLLLLDVMMPEMDGPATLRGIRAVPGYETIPAVFLTALSQPADLSGLRDEGALGVIRKPFDVMGLADQLRSLWRLHCEAEEHSNHSSLFRKPDRR